jgi:ubiquinone/menaquinone biosynthesis C-methylase UbiE
VAEELGFGGEVAGFYHQYRRGYTLAVIDTLIDAFSLTSSDLVIDLGCGTGQLTLPIARRVHVVAGVDPEPHMLARARQAASSSWTSTRKSGARQANCWVRLACRGTGAR